MTTRPTDMLYIFSQQTVDATSDIYYLDFTSNKCVVSAWGEWDGASLILQVGTVPTLDNTTTWITITDRLDIPFAFTTNITKTLTEYVNGQPIRGVLSDSGASTNINCTVQVI